MGGRTAGALVTSAAATQALSPSLQMHKYEELKCIGRGSYGSAHVVIERATGDRYVIKKIPMELLSDHEKQQSFREVELLAKLKHPNVVEYKESFVEADVIHIVMAYCDGGDLAGRIRERATRLAAQSGKSTRAGGDADGNADGEDDGRGEGQGDGSIEPAARPETEETGPKPETYFATSQILDWFVQMAMAIKYLHEQRILHRDLKTSNIFLTTENVIKLGDFGIAKTLDSTLDQARTVVGTPYYMSPEVCESKPYSYASDVWSLGCVLFEMCALKHAFDAPNILTLILKIVQQDFGVVPPHLDPEIGEILKKLLEKVPERRPSMDQIFMMPYIRNHMQGLAVSGGSLKSVRRAHANGRRRVHPAPSVGRNGRRPSIEATAMAVNGASGRRRGGRDGQPSTAARWVAIAVNDSAECLTGADEDLQLLDASVVLDESQLGVCLPARSTTPEPLLLGSPDKVEGSAPYQQEPGSVLTSPLRTQAVQPAALRRPVSGSGTAWSVSDEAGECEYDFDPDPDPDLVNTVESQRRKSTEEVEEEIVVNRSHAEAEVLMNPNFQDEYSEECMDSQQIYYSSQAKSKGRRHSGSRRQLRHRHGHHHHPRMGGKPSGGDVPRSSRDHRHSNTHSMDASDDVVVEQSRGKVMLRRSETDLVQTEERNDMQANVGHGRRWASRGAQDLNLELSLDDVDNLNLHDVDGEAGEPSESGNLSESGILRELELEAASSGDDNGYADSSDSEYGGEENFYSEHSDYSEDMDFGIENETEYSDDFEDSDAEIIEYANDDEFILDEAGGSDEELNPTSSEGPPVALIDRVGRARSPTLVRSPGQRRTPPTEVQWVMRNVAQSLLESCDNFNVSLTTK